MDKQRTILIVALILALVGHVVSWLVPQQQVIGNVLGLLAALTAIAGFTIKPKKE